MDARQDGGPLAELPTELRHDPRVEAVLAHLEAAGGRCPVSELTRHVAAREADGEVPVETYRAVHLSVHRTYLPALADHGVVAYDAERGTVSLR